MMRPLIGEPLPLDLLNTQWVGPDGPHDALDSAAGLVAWLAERSLPTGGEPGRLATHLKATRAAVRRALERPEEPASYDALNAILARGHLRDRLDPDGGQRVVEVIEESERVAWQAAHEFVQLRRERPERIRRCQGQGCVLWFLDTTRSDTRRWCSMEGCGNRAKVRRHRAQQH